MADFRVRVLLAPPGASDVATRELSVVVNELDPVKVDLDAGQTEYVFIAPDAAVVELSHVDIDTSGNRSSASTRTFTVVDTIPPPQPGELTVEVIEQID